MLKVVFIGCVEFSHVVLIHLLKLDGIDVIGVVSRTESKFNTDFRNLSSISHEYGIECFLAAPENSEEMADWISGKGPDVIFCIGWSQLLSQKVLDIPPMGVVGYHPAPLPRNRGRHPIIWALCLGLDKTASTFFLMDDGIDSGDIVSQVSVPLSEVDDARSVYGKLLISATKQVSEIVDRMLTGTLDGVPQNSAEATYWRKRSTKDGEIDWRMSARSICYLVRALTRPYAGAHCLIDGVETKIWKATHSDIGQADVEPGKVVAVDSTLVTVRCGDGSIDLTEHELPRLPKIGDYM